MKFINTEMTETQRFPTWEISHTCNGFDLHNFASFLGFDFIKNPTGNDDLLVLKFQYIISKAKKYGVKAPVSEDQFIKLIFKQVKSVQVHILRDKKGTEAVSGGEVLNHLRVEHPKEDVSLIWAEFGNGMVIKFFCRSLEFTSTRFNSTSNE